MLDVHIVGALLLVACSAERPAAPVKAVSGPPPSAAAAVSVAPVPVEAIPWPPAPPPGASGDFCTPVVTALDADSCYVLPDSPPRELLLYLHGIVPPAATSVQKTNFQTVVANASRRAGVAALLPRGRRGLAPKGHDGWWGWPTAVADYNALAGELVAGFAEKRHKLEALIGHPFERLYVAGSSSGAYFVVALALNGGITADGFGAMSGGAFRQTTAKSAAIAPFYIGYGTRDTVGESARLLATRLREARWPVELAAHPLPHGAAEVYLDEAIAFWRKR